MNAALPRSLQYADIGWTVTEAVISNESLDTYGTSSTQEIGDQYYARVRATGLLEVHSFLNFKPSYFSLQLADGSVIAPHLPASTPSFDSMSVSRGYAQDVLLAFPVGTSETLTGAVLSIAEPGFEPATVALTGASTPASFPASATVDGTSRTATSDTCSNALEIKVLSAETDLDVVVGSSFERRAALGERFLRVTARATSFTSWCDGVALVEEDFRVIVNGAARAAQNDGVEKLILKNESYEFTLAFIVPAGASMVQFEAGAADEETARFTVLLPDR